MTFSLAHPHSHSHALWVTSSRSLLFTSPLVPFTVSLDVNSRIMHVNHLPDSSAATAVFFPLLAALHPGSPSSDSSSFCTTLHACRGWALVTSPKESCIRRLTSSQLRSSRCGSPFDSLQLLPGSAMYVRRKQVPQVPLQPLDTLT